MKEKMAKSRAKGRGGWDDPAQCSVEVLQAMLLDHLAKGDAVDIGNFSMMLWNRGAEVAAPGSATAGAAAEIYADLLVIQRREAESDPSDHYMRGLYNGMAMMVANFDNAPSWEPLPKPAPAGVSPPDGAMPEQFVRVPKEPTDVMLEAGAYALPAYYVEYAAKVYKAMIAAQPAEGSAQVANEDEILVAASGMGLLGIIGDNPKREAALIALVRMFRAAPERSDTPAGYMETDPYKRIFGIDSIAAPTAASKALDVLSPTSQDAAPAGDHPVMREALLMQGYVSSSTYRAKDAGDSYRNTWDAYLAGFEEMRRRAEAHIAGFIARIDGEKQGAQGEKA